MERVLDKTLTQSTYYFSYYQLEALRKAGLGETLRRPARAVAGDAGPRSRHRP